MKTVVMFAMALLMATPVLAAGGGFQKEKFTKVVYLAYGGTGDGSNPAAPKSLNADSDLWAIPANTVIEKVYVVIDTAIAGTTNMDIGDDDDADGFVDSSGSVTLGTEGMYGWNAKTAGAYLRVETAGGTDALDLYVVPNAKYYAATGKEVKLDISGTNSAGKVRVVIEGYYLGARNQ
jgi:uncharacterized protein YdeI (BOF family)